MTVWNRRELAERRAEYFACSAERATAEVQGWDDDDLDAAVAAEDEAREALPCWARWGGWLPR